MTIKVNSALRVVNYYPPVGLSTLFRPLPKCDENARPKLDVTYQAATGGPVLRFSAKSALGIPEQTLLLVLLELAQIQYQSRALEMVVNSGTADEIGRGLWAKLNKQNQAADGQTLRLETTWFEMNSRCGVPTGGSARAMREKQLERLCEVTVWEQDADEKHSKRQTFLVAWLRGDDDRINLVLNARLASAVLGEPYAKVSLVERLALHHDVSKALHAFLSTTVSPGHSLRIKVETLIERLWPGSAENSLQVTHRRHRKSVRDGLCDIGRLDKWTVVWEREGLAHVTQQSSSVTNMTCHIGNKTMSYRERALPIITSKNNELTPFDASGLFFTSAVAA